MCVSLSVRADVHTRTCTFLWKRVHSCYEILKGFRSQVRDSWPRPHSSILLPQQGTLRVPDSPSYPSMALACVLAVASSPAFLLLLPPDRGILEYTSQITSLLCSNAAVAPTSPRVRPESSMGNEAPPRLAWCLPNHRPPHSLCSPTFASAVPSVCTAFRQVPRGSSSS